MASELRQQGQALEAIAQGEAMRADASVDRERTTKLVVTKLEREVEKLQTSLAEVQRKASADQSSFASASAEKRDKLPAETASLNVSNSDHKVCG